jgi:hypothetical protein
MILSRTAGRRLWVIRVGLPLCLPLPVCPDERTSTDRPAWSVSCHEETHAPQQIGSLFDHVVGAGEQHRWYFEAKRFGSLEIDN